VNDISVYVGTRTATQVRSHAQKYFIRLAKQEAAKARASLGDAAPHTNGINSDDRPSCETVHALMAERLRERSTLKKMKSFEHDTNSNTDKHDSKSSSDTLMKKSGRPIGGGGSIMAVFTDGGRTGQSLVALTPKGDRLAKQQRHALHIAKRKRHEARRAYMAAEKAAVDADKAMHHAQSMIGHGNMSMMQTTQSTSNDDYHHDGDHDDDDDDELDALLSIDDHDNEIKGEDAKKAKENNKKKLRPRKLPKVVTIGQNKPSTSGSNKSGTKVTPSRKLLATKDATKCQKKASSISSPTKSPSPNSTCNSGSNKENIGPSNLSTPNKSSNNSNSDMLRLKGNIEAIEASKLLTKKRPLQSRPTSSTSKSTTPLSFSNPPIVPRPSATPAAISSPHVSINVDGRASSSIEVSSDPAGNISISACGVTNIFDNTHVDRCMVGATCVRVYSPGISLPHPSTLSPPRASSNTDTNHTNEGNTNMKGQEIGSSKDNSLYHSPSSSSSDSVCSCSDATPPNFARGSIYYYPNYHQHHSPMASPSPSLSSPLTDIKSNNVAVTEKPSPLTLFGADPSITTLALPSSFDDRVDAVGHVSGALRLPSSQSVSSKMIRVPLVALPRTQAAPLPARIVTPSTMVTPARVLPFWPSGGDNGVVSSTDKKKTILATPSRSRYETGVTVCGGLLSAPRHGTMGRDSPMSMMRSLIDSVDAAAAIRAGIKTKPISKQKRKLTMIYHDSDDDVDDQQRSRQRDDSSELVASPQKKVSKTSPGNRSSNEESPSSPDATSQSLYMLNEKYHGSWLPTDKLSSSLYNGIEVDRPHSRVIDQRVSVKGDMEYRVQWCSTFVSSRSPIWVNSPSCRRRFDKYFHMINNEESVDDSASSPFSGSSSPQSKRPMRSRCRPLYGEVPDIIPCDSSLPAGELVSMTAKSRGGRKQPTWQVMWQDTWEPIQLLTRDLHRRWTVHCREHGLPQPIPFGKDPISAASDSLNMKKRNSSKITTPPSQSNDTIEAPNMESKQKRKPTPTSRIIPMVPLHNLQMNVTSPNDPKRHAYLSSGVCGDIDAKITSNNMPPSMSPKEEEQSLNLKVENHELNSLYSSACMRESPQMIMRSYDLTPLPNNAPLMVSQACTNRCTPPNSMTAPSNATSFTFSYSIASPMTSQRRIYAPLHRDDDAIVMDGIANVVPHLVDDDGRSGAAAAVKVADSFLADLSPNRQSLRSESPPSAPLSSQRPYPILKSSSLATESLSFSLSAIATPSTSSSSSSLTPLPTATVSSMSSPMLSPIPSSVIIITSNNGNDSNCTTPSQTAHKSKEGSSTTTSSNTNDSLPCTPSTMSASSTTSVQFSCSSWTPSPVLHKKPTEFATHTFGV
jgi:hypothetical protein